MMMEAASIVKAYTVVPVMVVEVSVIKTFFCVVWQVFHEGVHASMAFDKPRDSAHLYTALYTTIHTFFFLQPSLPLLTVKHREIQRN